MATAIMKIVGVVFMAAFTMGRDKFLSHNMDGVIFPGFE